jgi:hypothetical protein
MYLDGSRMLHERACAVGVENQFYTFLGAPHVPYAGSTAYMDTTVNFFRDFLIKQLGCTDAIIQAENSPAQAVNLYSVNYCDGTPVDEVCPTSGMSELNTQKLLIYPNPATTELTLSFSDNEQHTIIIKDMMGRIVFEKSEMTSSTKINLSFLKSGNYMVVADGIQTTKLIKN